MPARFSRRRFVQLAASASALSSVARPARANTYPTRPVRMVVGFPASNASDIVARLAGQNLSERLGQSFIVENRPGAGGNIGVEFVVNAAPDGYTLLAASTSAAINATLYGHLNFNFLRDIAPVAGVARAPYVLVVTPAFPATTIAEFIAYAKANPGKINMASAGNGSLSHLCGELFKTMAGIDMVHVPYRTSFLPICLPDRSRSCSARSRNRSNMSAAANCARLPSPRQRVSRRCRISPRSPNSSRAMRPAAGTASARRRTRPPTSSRA